MKAYAVLLVLMVCVPIARGQQASGTPGPDSSHAGGIIFLGPDLSPGRPLFLFPSDLEYPPVFGSPTFFFESLPGNSFTPVPGLFATDKVDLVAPLRLQWEREAHMGTLRTILGSIQLGGVAYLAYRHLTKSSTMTVRPRLPKNLKK